jgi:hypothetical protein
MTGAIQGYKMLSHQKRKQAKTTRDEKKKGFEFF